MARKNILCCGLLAGALFFRKQLMSPAVTPAANTVQSLT